MAKIGLKYLVAKPVTGAGSVIAKMIQADVSISIAEVKLYADDALSEMDASFQNGSVSLGIDDLTAAIQVMLLGHTKDGTTDEITTNTDDNAPFVGIGFYGAKVKDGVKAYRALFFPKVKFTEPSENMATKGEVSTFGTDTIVGTIFPDAIGDWKKEQTFPTELEAVTYLNTKAGIVVTP